MNISRNKLAVTIMASALSYQAAAKDFALEEIIVTAQKKSESLMDIPVSVTAVSGDQLDAIGGFELTDISKATSGLQVQTSGNNTNINLRGIDSNLGAAATQRVTAYFNGSYMPDQRQVWLSNYDMDRIEILRGPQGTLYGASSPTGAIVLYPKKPSLNETEGFIRQTSGEHGLSNTQFAYNAPIIDDELAIRVSGVYDENNSADAEYLHGEELLKRTESMRASLLWAPTETFDANLVYTYTEAGDNNGGTEQGNGIEPKDRVTAANAVAKKDVRISTVILSLNWDLGFADLTSQSLYSQSDNDTAVDYDGTPADFGTAYAFMTKMRSFNHEFRLSSTGNETWDWINGVYYSRNSNAVNSGISRRNSLINGAGVLGFGPGGPIIGPMYLPLELDVDINAENFNVSYALFTHNSFYLTEDWTLTAGLRWNKDRKSNKTTREIAIAVDPDNISGIVGVDLGAPFGVVVPAASTTTDTIADNLEKDTNLTGTIKLQYKINEDQNVYFTYDRGGRSGGVFADIDGSTAQFAPQKLTFEAETANSLEIGYKATFLENRLNFSAALYQTVYKDFQLDAAASYNNAGELNEIYFIDNVPEVVARGLELETSYLATENLLLSASVAYTNSKFEDYDEAACVDGDAIANGLASGDYLTCNLTDEDVGGLSSRWSTTLSANYSRPVNFMDAEWYLSGLMNYNSSRTDTFSRRDTGGFSTFDISTGLQAERWDVRLWVKNVFDKQAAILPGPDTAGQSALIPDPSVTAGPGGNLSGSEALVESGYFTAASYTNPRQVGVTATYHF